LAPFFLAVVVVVVVGSVVLAAGAVVHALPRLRLVLLLPPRQRCMPCR
jgi:hypothetical protein